MAKLTIPPLGTELTLASDWTFELSGDWDNRHLFAALGRKRPTDKNGYYDDKQFASVTLPAGTMLKIRTYRIRLGQALNDRVTFSAKIGKKSHRFWVKLADANRIELASDDSADMEDPITIPRGLVAAACSAIDKKRDAPVVLAKLRRYTTGDLSGFKPKEPAHG